MTEHPSAADADPPGASRRRPRWLAWALLGLCAAGLVTHARMYNFVCDDAYISFRYSHNLAYHGELVFNLGERVEGYTNFLWTVLLALLLKVGLRPEVMSLVLGAGFGVSVLLLLYALGRLYHGGRPTGWDFVGAALLPTWGTFAVWCSGGLETQMFCALSFGGFVLYAAEHAGRVRGRWSGFVFALASMTRPEGLLLFGLTGLHRLAANLIGERRLLPTRAELIWVAGFLLPFGLFFAWRYSYYGYPFPNTFYVKAGGGLATAKKWGLPYLWDFVDQNRLYALAPLLLFFRPRARCRADAAAAPSPSTISAGFLWSYALLICVTYVSYVAWVGGDFMTMGRFFLPLLPYFALFAQEGLRDAVERFPWWRRRDPASPTAAQWRPARMVPVTLLVIAGFVVNSVWLHRENQKLAYHRWGLDTIAYLKKFADDRVIIGNWMRGHLPKDTYISVGGAGSNVYASRLRALDAFGLNDEWIAHHGPRRGDRPGHAKFAPESYVLQRKPDLICHIGHHQDFLYRPPAHEARYWKARGYRWICLNPEGVRPRYYCCLKRIERDLGPYVINVGP